MQWAADFFHRLRRPEPGASVTVQANPAEMVLDSPVSPKFCDIHTHVLYGLDDGSRDLGSSLEMLRIAVQHGTSDLVASPHSDLRYRYNKEKIDAQIAELSEKTE